MKVWVCDNEKTDFDIYKVEMKKKIIEKGSNIFQSDFIVSLTKKEEFIQNVILFLNMTKEQKCP